MTTHRPMILGLSEANFYKEHDQSLVDVPGFNFHVCPTINNPRFGISRIVVYTHENLVVQKRLDLMTDSYSSIWLELGIPRQKKFLVCQTYRQWQNPNQNGDKSSLSIQEQHNRWIVFFGPVGSCFGNWNGSSLSWRHEHKSLQLARC